MSTASGSSDDIVMRLILKNQEPAEAARLARMPIEAIRAEYAAGAQKIQEAFTRSYEAQTKESQKAAKEEIKLQQQKTREIVAALKEVEKENAQAAKGISANWRRTMEDLENFTTVAKGAWGVMSAGYDRFKQLGTEMIHVTNVFGSLKQSIEGARQATQGTVADIELISARNRALEMDLDLTSEQFSHVAFAADAFADAVGINGKEALDKMIQGLAEGRVKTLAHAGIVVDADKAYENFGNAIHVAADKLTDAEKRTAIQTVALEKMSDKFNTTADSAENFATVIERSLVSQQNEWDRLLAKLGSWQPPEWIKKLFDKSLVNRGLASGFSQDELDSIRSLDPDGARDIQIKKLREGAAKAREENARMIEEARARGEYYEGGGYHGIAGRSREYTFEIGSENEKPQTKYDLLADYMRDAARRVEAATVEAENARQEALALLGQDFDKVTGRYSEADAGGAERYSKQRLDQIGRNFAGGDYSSDEYKQFATAQGKAAKALRYQQASGVSLKDARGDANLDEDFIKNLESEIKASREKAGGGILGQILFGDDTSLDQTYDKLSKAKQFAIDNFAEIGNAGEQMAGALGQSLAAAIGENKNFKEAMKSATHAVLMGLSQQAFVKAAMSTAEGILALTNPVTAPTAPGYFLAAAAFAGVGTLAGLGARATYSAPSTGSTPTSVRGSSAGVGGGSRSSAERNQPDNVTFNINAMFGDRVAIARGIEDALQAYARHNGRPISLTGN